jgi:uncharacterized membrane protein
VAGDLSAFTNMTGAFYREEVDRATAWRARLDQTTNWAVVIVAAILTWVFSSANNPHYVVLIGIAGVVAFLVMESHRYREYDIWRNRVRTIQTELIAEMYAPDPSLDARWQTELSEDLRSPSYRLSFRQAVTHRLRRAYLPLLLILLAAWAARVVLLEPDKSWRATASILGVPGEVVAAAVGGFYVVVVALTVISAFGEGVHEFHE